MRFYCYPPALALLLGRVTCLTSLPTGDEQQGPESKIKGALHRLLGNRQAERRMSVNLGFDKLPSLEGISGMYLPEKKLFGEHCEESLYLSFLNESDKHKMKLGFMTKAGPGERYKIDPTMERSQSPWFNITLNWYLETLRVDQDSLNKSQREDLEKFLEKLRPLFKVDEGAKLQDFIILEVQEDNTIFMKIIRRKGEKAETVLFTRAATRPNLEIVM